MIKFFGACKLGRFNYAGLERLPSHELLDSENGSSSVSSTSIVVVSRTVATSVA
jgi:hypothetical protein